jgi:small subunit ribosomal protein S8e
MKPKGSIDVSNTINIYVVFKMTQWQMRSKRKITGGLLNRMAKKKKHQRGRDFLPALIGEKKIKHSRVRGGMVKRVVLSSNIANVAADGKIQKSKILGVADNKADAQFIRRGIITKGAIINTELGAAKVTSRPGQDGTINAVLVKEKAKKA